MRRWLLPLRFLVLACTVHACAGDVHRAPCDLADEKAVFATVESPNVVPARARIGGTVASLSVHQGDAVTQGQVIAVVGDEKLLLQINSLDAQIAGLQSQLAQAQIDFTRAETLFRQGAGRAPRSTRRAPRWRSQRRHCAPAPPNARWRSRISRRARCWRRSPAAC